jgi:hypothetical protein
MRIQFAGTVDAERAAAILAGALRRQGYVCTTRDAAVTVNTPGPDSVLITLDETIASTADAVVVGSARPSCLLQDRLSPRAPLTAVNACDIAADEGADAIVPLLGGAARALPFIDADALGEAVWAEYDWGFGYGARAALKAFQQGYQQAHTTSGAVV